MVPEWLCCLEHSINTIKSNSMNDYIYSEYIDAAPKCTDNPILEYTNVISDYAENLRHAYAEVYYKDFLLLLTSEFMQNCGILPDKYYRNDSQPSRYGILDLLDDSFDIFSYEYFNLRQEASSHRSYAIINNNEYFYHGNETFELLTPNDVMNTKAPYVSEMQPDGFIASKPMTMLFTPKRTPFVELAKKYGLLGRGRATGYKISKVAGYDRRNYDAIFNPNNDHMITPGQMFAICFICKMNVKEAITFFHECEELNELPDYGVPAAVLVNMLFKECYDYELFLKFSCETFKYLNEDLPKYLSSNLMWQNEFNRV